MSNEIDKFLAEKLSGKSNKNLFEQLNTVYKPMCEKSGEICDCLQNKGYKISSGFYNNHSKRIDGEFSTEFFPVPIISIENIGDVGIDIDEIWLEGVMSKEKAKDFDYSHIGEKYKFELYGVENYLTDLYNEQLNVTDIAEKIVTSEESHFCILVYFEQDVDIDGILKVVEILND